jgi:hypothetical protein
MQERSVEGDGGAGRPVHDVVVGVADRPDHAVDPFEPLDVRGDEDDVAARVASRAGGDDGGVGREDVRAGAVRVLEVEVVRDGVRLTRDRAAQDVDLVA